MSHLYIGKTWKYNFWFLWIFITGLYLNIDLKRIKNMILELLHFEHASYIYDFMHVCMHNKTTTEIHIAVLSSTFKIAHSAFWCIKKYCKLKFAFSSFDNRERRIWLCEKASEHRGCFVYWYNDNVRQLITLSYIYNSCKGKLWCFQYIVVYCQWQALVIFKLKKYIYSTISKIIQSAMI